MLITSPNACYQMVSTKKHTKKTLDSWNKSREKGIKKYQARIKAEGKKRTVNKTSDQQVLLNKVYAILCRELKPLHTKCEAKLLCCTGRATQIHHKQGRRGILLIMSKLFSYLCHNCHDFCTEHSKEAIEIGLSLPRNSKTEYEFTDREKELINKYNIRLPKGVYILSNTLRDCKNELIKPL